MSARGEEGYTLIEIILAVVIGGLLFLAVARLADAVTRVDGAARAGSDARAIQLTSDRVLRRALEEAGSGMMSAPNLAGIGAITATTRGVPADTLVVLKANGEPVDAATRSCPAGMDPCVALSGDYAQQFRAGDLIVVGSRALGMRAYQITATPHAFFAPCGADCPERLVCSAAAGVQRSFPRVVGSVKSTGGTSTAPCSQPFAPRGGGCQEVLQTSAPETVSVPFCRLALTQSPFTALQVTDRSATLGFPDPPATLLQSGARGTPRIQVLRVAASRFWIKAGPQDSMLVRQNGLRGAGSWNDPVPLAAPALAMTVETLHGSGWYRGVGLGSGTLALSTSNANLSWRDAPAPSATEAGFAFARGHHTVRAVRIRLRYAVLGTRGTREVREISLVAPTPSVLEGGTRDTP